MTRQKVSGSSCQFGICACCFPNIQDIPWCRSGDIPWTSVHGTKLHFILILHNRYRQLFQLFPRALQRVTQIHRDIFLAYPFEKSCLIHQAIYAGCTGWDVCGDYAAWHTDVRVCVAWKQSCPYSTKYSRLTVRGYARMKYWWCASHTV